MDLLATEYALGLALYNIPSIYTVTKNEGQNKVTYDLSKTTFNEASMPVGKTWALSVNAAKNGISAASEVSPSLKQRRFAATNPISFRVTQAAARFLGELDALEQPLGFLPDAVTLGVTIPLCQCEEWC